jgi:hypothetical protein
MVGNNLKLQKMKPIKIAFFIALMLLYACGVDQLNNPIGSTEVPKQVTVKEVVNISGASIIYYDRPNDANLQYVKAVWTTDDGIEYNQTASFYTDSVVVDGFGSEGSFKVKLYSVSHGQTFSAPVEVTVNPLRPPYLMAYDNLQINPTFMGIRVTTENETGAKLAFRTFKQDLVTNEWVEVGTHYTVAPSVEYFNREHEPDIDQNFRVQIRDKWGHWSPPKDVVCAPWFEMQLPKNLFKEVALCNLDGDGSYVPDQTGYALPSNFWGHKMHSWSGSNVQFTRLFDGVVGSSSECYHTKPLAPFPHHFTIDLGDAYNLSRFILWPRSDAANQFRGGHPQIVQVYGATYTGSNPSELVDDIYDTNAWLDLGLFYLSRADGSFDPYPGTNDRTAEDNLIIQNGHEMTMKSLDQPVRYVRVQIIKTFATSVHAGSTQIGEISFFGSR